MEQFGLTIAIKHNFKPVSFNQLPSVKQNYLR